jgi:hypothetical protein
MSQQGDSIRTFPTYAGAAAVVVMLTMDLAAQAPAPAGTAFSYQGRLTDGGAPANGLYDLQFTLFDAVTGGAAVGAPVVSEDVNVASGLFTVMLDFGAVFEGHARWLEIAVRPGASTGAFTPLAARQAITPAPHALFSETTTWNGVSNLPAGFADGVDNDTLGALACAATQIPKWNGTAWACAPDRDALAALSCGVGQIAKWNGTAWACAIDGDASGTNWSIAGNAAVAGVTFLGTTNNTPLEVRVNGITGLRVMPATASSGISVPNVIGGDASNTITTGGSVIGGGSGNTVTQAGGVIGGGMNNTSSNYNAFVGGGHDNVAQNQASAVVGGRLNQATGFVSFVGAGSQNLASGGDSFVGGGFNNIGSGAYSVVVGGLHNTASGDYSFAAGSFAHAAHNGAFVWSDSSTLSVSPMQSTGTDQFIVGATGGVWFGRSDTTPSFPGFLNTGTGAYLSTGGIWTNASDRNLKEHFETVDGRALLDTLARLPVTRWNYKKEPGVEHIGPTAQDFQAIFGLGGDDKTITTLDPAGIALRAIQELDRANRELQTALQTQAREIDALKAQVARLGAARHASQRRARSGSGAHRTTSSSAQ